MKIERVMQQLEIDAGEFRSLVADYEKFAAGLPLSPEDYIRESYNLNLSSEYGGLPIKNPFGKGSGQLSLNVSQVKQDAQSGLGFVVLKTFIAQDPSGAQSMSDWAIPEARMVTERIKGADGQMGWTVTWKGRGWYDTFDAYLTFFAESLEIAKEYEMIVAPSCKYHLPAHGESEWKYAEYEYTTGRLIDVWQDHGSVGVMPIEKDFSPTLAGSDRASQMSTVLGWLQTVGELIKRAAHPRQISVGLKIFNAVFEDAFQLEMLRAVNEQCAGDNFPDFLVFANRLFDPNREFDGERGVAYGGPDLSARNLSVLARLRSLEQSGRIPVCHIPISATGNIDSGRMAAEYLLRGACSFQLHTYFQLPSSEYRMKRTGKTACVLHELYFNPERGLIAWLLHLRRALNWPTEWNVKRMADYCADPANGLWLDYEPALP
jgi:hypothetical protein